LLEATVRAGEWVLIMGAAGGLGSSAIQVAKLHEARVVAGASTDERMRNCVEFGADQGVNYREKDLAAEVERITAGHWRGHRG
jgi:NADPH2:quinone reductase